WGIIAILVGRAVVVYGLIGAGTRLFDRVMPGRSGKAGEDGGRSVPVAWLHVVFWAGLRGAVSVALALSLPADLPNRELISGLTFGIVLFTLIVQGSTTGWVVRRS